MKPCIFLILLTTFQLCYACFNEFNNKTEEYYVRYYIRRQTINIENSMIICSNIYSVNEIFYKYIEHNYDQFLKITDSNITTLHQNGLSKFTTIVKLYLSGIQIREILPGAFNGLLKLKELYLDRNKLTKLSKDIFTSLKELRILDLSYNQIQRIENFTLMGMSSLQKLNLQGNNVSYIDEKAFEETKHLWYLDLSDNPIKNVNFKDLPNLLNLYLNKTTFTEFSNFSNTAMRLDILNMTSNKITNVDFSKFPKVKVIDLSDNKIEVIEICENFTAVVFRVQNNPIKYVKNGFNNLEKLFMSHNELESINQTLLQNSRSITEVDLSFNKISIIEPNAFKNLSLLRKLRLDNNKIRNLTISLFNDLKNLVLLNLAFNNIEKIRYGTFNKLLSLEILDISHNNILDLQPHDFYSQPSLRYLNISHNNISSFDVKDLKANIPSIRSISLSGNIWKCRQLAQISHTLKTMSVDLYVEEKNNSYDGENVKGIPCQNDDTLKNNTDSYDKAVFQEFQRLMNESAKNSEYLQFFDNDFKSSNFAKFFQQHDVRANDSVGLKTTSTKTESGDGTVLVLTSVLQVVMCFLLIFIAYVVLGFLKKLNQKIQNPPGERVIQENENRNLSQVELCPPEA